MATNGDRNLAIDTGAEHIYTSTPPRSPRPEPDTISPA